MILTVSLKNHYDKNVSFKKEAYSFDVAKNSALKTCRLFFKNDGASKQDGCFIIAAESKKINTAASKKVAKKDETKWITKKKSKKKIKIKFHTKWQE